MFAVIYIPDFSLQAVLRHQSELQTRAVAVVDGPRTLITELTASARAAGVQPGMSATQAMARCPKIVIKSRSVPQENAANEALLQAAYTVSPSIEATGPGACTIALKGLRNVVEPQFGERILATLRRIQLQAQIGVAENPLLAWHAARQARPFLAITDSTAFLDTLPIDCIDPSPAIRTILNKWGIRTLGAFTSLGKSAITERLGPEAADLFERAAARTTRPLRCVNPPDTFEETAEFENEIESLEPLLFILRRFLEQITRRLELAYWVAEELHLRLLLTDGNRYEHVFRIPAPTGHVETLFRTLHTHLENVRTKSPIIGVQLTATPCRAQAQQFALFETVLRDPNQFYETLARLSALVGANRVGIPVVESSHRPDAFHLAPVPLHAEGVAKKVQPKNNDAVGLPLRRFRPPISAEVQMDGARPVFLKTARFKTRITQVQGPWRSSGDWWDQQPWQREEWDVQTAPGALYRIYCDADGWFVEGSYD